MRTVYCPTRRRTYTVVQYIQAFGAKHDQFMRPRVRPAMSCYACNEPALPVSEDFPERGHWAHERKKDGEQPPWCPLRQPAAIRYEMLPDAPVNPEQGRLLRASFMAHWQQHWGMIVTMLLGIGEIHSFIEFVRHADRSRLWDRSGLEEWLIPYIYLATAEFPPPENPKAALIRSDYLRFWFDSGVRNLDDLWIRYTGNFRFMRARYRAPARGASPGPRHLLDAEPLEVDSEWLSRHFKPPYPYQLTKMRATFPDAA